MWSNEPPTVTGWYWHRFDRWQSVVRVFQKNDALSYAFVNEWGDSMEDDPAWRHGEWQGPIKPQEGADDDE